MDCSECVLPESTRYECILRIAELMQARKRLQSWMALESPKLNQGIAVAEAKLNEAWKDLTDDSPEPRNIAAGGSLSAPHSFRALRTSVESIPALLVAPAMGAGATDDLWTIKRTNR